MPLAPANPNAFANSPLDRAAHHRRDEAWLAAALERPDAQLCLFQNALPFADEQGVVWLGAHARALFQTLTAPIVFLGLGAEGAPHFALEAPERFDPAGTPLEGLGEFADMRALAARARADDLAILGAARALFEWHRKNGFCANCATPTRVEEAGWRRKCEACSTEHYPRVDPVAIMLPVKGDRCALGRQARFPPKFHSALAGFIEPGESIEEAVARETLEEAGLRVTRVRYLWTQPWPFPHQLMIGAIAEVENDDIQIDPFELEAARWFTRDEIRDMLAGRHPEAFCPPPFAIAHHLIKAWAEE